jgi:hypothetical protein
VADEAQQQAGAGHRLPSLAVAYAVYGLFLACVELFAAPAVASALVRLPDLLAQLCFTPRSHDAQLGPLRARVAGCCRRRRPRGGPVRTAA